MSINIKHPGALHREMHVKPRHKIPLSALTSKLRAAEKAHDTRLEKQVQFAINFHKGHS